MARLFLYLISLLGLCSAYKAEQAQAAFADVTRVDPALPTTQGAPGSFAEATTTQNPCELLAKQAYEAVQDPGPNHLSANQFFWVKVVPDYEDKSAQELRQMAVECDKAAKEFKKLHKAAQKNKQFTNVHQSVTQKTVAQRAAGAKGLDAFEASALASYAGMYIDGFQRLAAEKPEDASAQQPASKSLWQRVNSLNLLASRQISSSESNLSTSWAFVEVGLPGTNSASPETCGATPCDSFGD